MALIDATFTLDAGRLKRRFARLRRAFRGDLVEAMNDVLIEHERRYHKRFRKFPGRKAAMSGHPADALYARSGSLSRAYKREAAKVSGADKITVRSFVNHPAALIQELGTRILPGGAIKPKRGRFLTVPLPEALTPAGRPRFEPRLVRREGRFYTSEGDLTRISKGVIFAERGGKWRPIYVLKSRVKFPGRLGFIKSWRRMARFRNARFSKALGDAVDGSGRG